MGRRNTRGLELSFKPLKGGRGRGRWYKKVGGRAVYFGIGNGVSDRESYQLALIAYRDFEAAAKSAQTRSVATGITRRLQAEFSVLDEDGGQLQLEAGRALIGQLQKLEAPAAELFSRLADTEEKRRLITSLETRSLAEIKNALSQTAASPKATTVGALLDEFLIVQRERMERRRKLDALRAAGQNIREPAKQNISEARFVSIARDVAVMRGSVGSDIWDGTEARATQIVRKFRNEIDARVLSGDHSHHTFNDGVKLVRMFCAWAEAAHKLDRLPRERMLFAKYSATESSAKAIPMETLRKLWKASDGRGRCWLLLGLNCGYYAKDISDLTADMIDATHLRHVRQKTGVNVRYKLWPKTRELLKKHASKSGRAFENATGTPLVYYSKSKKSGDPTRIDNVRTWFFRLCRDHEIAGYSFSNVRDTAGTEVEKLNPAMVDLFTAHVDRRMACFYVDGKMVDTSALDMIIDQLEQRFSKVWAR